MVLLEFTGTMARPLTHHGPKAVGGDSHEAKVTIGMAEKAESGVVTSTWTLAYNGQTYESEKEYDLATDEKGNYCFAPVSPDCSSCCCVVFKGVQWPQPADMDVEDKVTYAKLCIGSTGHSFTDDKLSCPLYISTPMGSWKAGTEYVLRVNA